MSRKTRRNASKRLSNAVRNVPKTVDLPIIFRRTGTGVGFAGLALGSLAWSGWGPRRGRGHQRLRQRGDSGSRHHRHAAEPERRSDSQERLGHHPGLHLRPGHWRPAGLECHRDVAASARRRHQPVCRRCRPDHFSIEGSGITVRGLDSRTRSELNGRERSRPTTAARSASPIFPRSC